MPASVYEHEAPHEFATPARTISQIAIDPALGGPPIDPQMAGEQITDTQQPVHDEPEQAQHPLSEQYFDAPHGDPYAPQALNSYIVEHVPIKPEPTTRLGKRKRSRRSDKVCQKCQGDEVENKKTGRPEVILTCEDCGLRGHPSCMILPNLDPSILQAYQWKCSDCKTCEVCNEKGDEARMVLCDGCDRGWHLDCLDPPLDAPPNDRWFCPKCPSFPDGVASLEGGGGNSDGKAVVVSSDSSSSSGSDDDMDPNEPQPGKGRARQSKEATQHAELSTSPKKRKKRKRARLVEPSPLARSPLRIRLPRSGSRVEDAEQVKSPPGMFDDILDANQRDTSKTVIAPNDKARFERTVPSSDVPAEARPAAPTPGRDSEQPEAGPSTRPLRSSTLHYQQVPTTPTSQSPAPSTPGAPINSLSSTKLPLRIRSIRFGPYDIKTWYDAPFPEEYANIPDGKLWLCEFCLKYMKSSFGADRHRMKCKCKHPPGDEIYRDGAVSIFEVDGRKNKIYCQNLCLLSKMFLDHKSLFYDVEPFLFYVMSEVDENGARFLGYFSKEKRSPKDYNVSCIMTLPVRQRQGWGNLLIDFSYLLSKKEQRLGSPEKPLSGLGALGYKNYWILAVMRYLDHAPDHPRLEDICAATSMTLKDVHSTLVQLNMINVRDATPPPIRPSPGQTIKYPKGRKNGVARRHLQRTQTKDKAADGQFTPPTQYEISWDREKVSQYLRNWETKGYMTIRPEKLKWSPFLTTRTQVPFANGEAGNAGTPSTSYAPNNFDSLHRNPEKYPPDPEQDATSEDELPIGPSMTEKRAARLKRDQILAEEGTPTRRLRTQQSHETPVTPGKRKGREPKKAVLDEASRNGTPAGRVASQRRVGSSPDETRHAISDEHTNGLNDRLDTPNEEQVKSEGSATPLNSRQSLPSDDTLVANALLVLKDPGAGQNDAVGGQVREESAHNDIEMRDEDM